MEKSLEGLRGQPLPHLNNNNKKELQIFNALAALYSSVLLLNMTNPANNLEKEEQSWGYHNSRFRDILQSYSNPNSMLLAQKQTQRATELNRELRDNPTLIWSINLPQRSKKVQWC